MEDHHATPVNLTGGSMTYPSSPISVENVHRDRDALRRARTPEEVGARLRSMLQEIFPGRGGLIVLTKTDPTCSLSWGQSIPVDESAIRETARRVALDGQPKTDPTETWVPIERHGTAYGAIQARLSPGDVASRHVRLLDLVAREAGRALSDAWTRNESFASESPGLAVTFSGGDISFTEAKKAFERWLVEDRLGRHRGNIAAAARALSMDRAQLSRLVKRHGIDKMRFRRMPTV